MSENPKIYAKGAAGQLSLYKNKLVIHRKGFLAGMRGDTEIPIRAITSVAFKKAGLFSSGYIQIVWPGAPQNDSLVARNFKSSDPRVVMFSKPQQRVFEAIKNELEKMIYGDTKQ